MNEVMMKCLVKDKVHWENELTRLIFTRALSLVHFNITFSYNPLTCFRLAVQKHLSNNRFKCGGTYHSAKYCTRSELRCIICRKRTHCVEAGGFKFLPSRHCATFTHGNTNVKDDCPFKNSALQTMMMVSNHFKYRSI